MSGGDCPACLGRWPAPDQRIADLGLSVAYLAADQAFPGWTILVLKRHATELFELSRDERSRLIEEVTAIAQALTGALDAVKINYALLGNQIPHVHWHVVPRLRDDPAPREPAWSLPHTSRALDGGERTARITLIRGRLETGREPAEGE